MGSAEGRFAFTTELFADSAMSDIIASGSHIAVNETVYVRITFDGPDLLKMTVTGCRGTDTADPANATVSWDLVKYR